MLYLFVSLLTVVLQTGIFFLLLRKFGNSLILNIAEGLKEIFEKPTVKRGFALMGSLGGDARAQKNIEATLAKGFIDKNYGLIKMMGEKVLGLDVDDLIEEYGPENIIGAMQNLLPKLGINPQDLLKQGAKGLNNPFSFSTTGNPGKAWYEQ